ncbi:hypothetical protein B0H10DRAFT_903785 [Mycena sp. CBHHK59/15]|nr:hypothetical protein B0H10DRAFT_903785 [Mycena sp. CBHHK59/15]
MFLFFLRSLHVRDPTTRPPATRPARARPARAPPVVVPRQSVRAVRRTPDGARGQGAGEGRRHVVWAECSGGRCDNPRRCLPRLRASTDGTLYQIEVYAASHTPAPPALNTHTSHDSNASSASHGSYASSGSHASHPSSSSHGSYPSTTSHHSSASGPKATTKGWGDRPVLLPLGIRLGLDGVNPVYYETIKMLYTFPQSVGIGRPSSSYYFVGVQGEGFFYLDPHHSRPTVPLRPAPIPYSSTSEPSASRAGSQEPCDARSVSPPMTEDELILKKAGLGGMTRADEAHYVHAYSTAELRTFHCEKVRKMPLSGLGPSMFIGFVCRDEADWVDLRRRVALLLRTIFAIQDEPPTWPGAADDDDMGLESISDPEEGENVGVDDGRGG